VNEFLVTQKHAKRKSTKPRRNRMELNKVDALYFSLEKGLVVELLDGTRYSMRVYTGLDAIEEISWVNDSEIPAGELASRAEEAE
jgi:hypothetical protein